MFGGVCTVFEWGKKNRNAQSANDEGVTRGALGAEDRAPKARGVSMQLGGLGEHCKLPQRVQAEPGRQTTLVHFGLNMRYLARPSLGETYAW